MLLSCFSLECGVKTLLIAENQLPFFPISWTLLYFLNANNKKQNIHIFEAFLDFAYWWWPRFGKLSMIPLFHQASTTKVPATWSKLKQQFQTKEKKRKIYFQITQTIKTRGSCQKAKIWSCWAFMKMESNLFNFWENLYRTLSK